MMELEWQNLFQLVLDVFANFLDYQNLKTKNLY